MKIVIRVPPFDINQGGVIALHRLCHLLRQEGVEAYIWPNEKPAPYNNNPCRTFYRFVRYYSKMVTGHKFKLYDYFNTPIARYSDLRGAIVVYAEGVDGNPLLSSRVVRWLLHKPGFHTGRVNYGASELLFYYQKAFSQDPYNLPDDRMLKVTMILDDIYKDQGNLNRAGSCYIIRKGKDRSDIPDLSGEIVIDGRSHEEIATIFNQVEYCISYDLYTMYSRYAALCGCKSVVVPVSGLPKEQWRPEEYLRYGVAYGFDDLPYADQTRPLLIKALEEEKVGERLMVRRFIKICRDHFGR